MIGWRSRYDYEGMSNIEKLAGRKLHTQDNSWMIAKVLMVALAALTIYSIICGDINLHETIIFFKTYLL